MRLVKYLSAHNVHLPFLPYVSIQETSTFFKTCCLNLFHFISPFVKSILFSFIHLFQSVVVLILVRAERSLSTKSQLFFSSVQPFSWHIVLPFQKYSSLLLPLCVWNSLFLCVQPEPCKHGHSKSPLINQLLAHSELLNDGVFAGAREGFSSDQKLFSCWELELRKLPPVLLAAHPWHARGAQRSMLNPSTALVT